MGGVFRMFRAIVSAASFKIFSRSFTINGQNCQIRVLTKKGKKSYNMENTRCGLLERSELMGRKIWNVVLTCLLIIALGLTAAFTGSRLFGLTPSAVTSGSMEPLYPVGSIIYVKQASPQDVQVGEAITFYLNRSTVATHQVWAIEGESFRTQGIANRDSEGNILHDAVPVPYEDLIGKPVACLPYLGFLYGAIRTPVGICVLIFLGAGVCLVSLLMDSGSSAPSKKGGKRILVGKHLQKKGSRSKKESDTA